MTRRFLFLQGKASPFFAQLGTALIARGHDVRRINFCGGDRLFWPLAGAVDYRGAAGDWPRFLSQKLNEWRTTDIVLFGDCRPRHVEAIKIARLRRTRVHVFEEGYLRPNWVTLEQGGVNASSSLPRDPDWYLAAASEAQKWDGGKRVVNRFALRGIDEFLYHLARIALRWRYPRYRTHLATNPVLEGLGWIRRFFSWPLRRARTAADLRNLAAAARPYYVFPLQLEWDSQVRFHSPFPDLEAAIEHVAMSFARGAPAETSLVVKRHPLDAGLQPWRRIVARLARRLRLGDRLIYLDDGPLERLLQGSLGVVTINSTVGFLAMSFGLPVIALGSAIYDMPSLTFQRGLEHFWKEGSPPDERVFDAFRRVVAERTQVNGGFFSREGLAMAVEGAAQRLEGAADFAARAKVSQQEKAAAPMHGKRFKPRLSRAISANIHPQASKNNPSL